MGPFLVLLLENLPAILALFENCSKRDGAKTVYDRLRNPGMIERWALRQTLQAQGLRGRDLREAVEAGMDWLRKADEDDIRELLKDAGVSI